MRVLIVSRTRMRGDRVCVGAHDLADFKSLRLYRHDGTYLTISDNVSVGQIWELTYRPKPDTVPPHVEDVIVDREGANRIGREQNLAALIQGRDTIWRTPAQLFEGRLQFTASGSAYVPAGGPLPSRSTGYWLLDEPLTREEYDEKTRYMRGGADGLRRISYVGTAAHSSDDCFRNTRPPISLEAICADGGPRRVLAPAFRLVLGRPEAALRA